MADPYSDSHVSYDMLDLIEAAGHNAVRSQSVGLGDAGDHEHLWYAAQHQRIVISSDTGFPTWHRMWLFFARVWNVDVHHSGILIIPNKSRMSIQQAAHAITTFIQTHPDLQDQCFTLRVDGSWRRDSDA